MKKSRKALRFSCFAFLFWFSIRCTIISSFRVALIFVFHFACVGPFKKNKTKKNNPTSLSGSIPLVDFLFSSSILSRSSSRFLLFFLLKKNINIYTIIVSLFALQVCKKKFAKNCPKKKSSSLPLWHRGTAKHEKIIIIKKNDRARHSHGRPRDTEGGSWLAAVRPSTNQGPRSAGGGLRSVRPGNTANEMSPQIVPLSSDSPTVSFHFFRIFFRFF